jgi:nitrous oxidase accessory protein
MNRECRSPQTLSQRLLPAALGWVSAGLLAVSMFFPYWQARLFAPQYRNGLTMTMYVNRVVGDIDEIDELNHYIGVPKLGSLAKFERMAAIPGIVLLMGLCLAAFRKTGPVLCWAKVAAVASFPVVFVADMAFWMRYASTHLDPTAPIKLKAVRLPFIGVGKVAQFRSELWPQTGYYLALTAALLMVAGWWLSREKRAEAMSWKRAALACFLIAACAAASRAEPGLQARLDAAPESSVVELAAGIYEGGLVILKPLTLRSSAGAVIDGRGKGTVLTVKAPNVLLEGLTIRGSGESMLFEDAGVRVEAASVTIRHCVLEDVLFGLFLVHGPAALLEDSVLRGKKLDLGRRGDLVRAWNSDGTTVRRNRLEGGRDMVLWFSTGSVVENNVVSGGRYGMHFMYTNFARVAGNRFSDNSVGFYSMYSHDVLVKDNIFERHRGPSGSALGLKESDSITVVGNTFIGNRQGAYIDQSPLLADNVNLFERNVFAHNDIGLSILPGVKGNVFVDNSFDDNIQQVSLRGGGTLTGNDWSRNGRGNYWSDYAGYGLAGSAVGRIPYRVASAWENLLDRVPSARFFLFTPAAQAVELVGRAFPVFRPKTIFTDPYPLLTPPVQPASPAQEPVLAALWLPLGLLGLSGFFAAWLKKARILKTSFVCKAPSPKGAAVIAKGVRKSFGSRVILNGLDLSLERGRSLVLWGSNGAGKSTFIKCLLGLHDFDGELSVFGRDAKSEGHLARRHIGYLSQEFAGYDWTVRQAMEFVCAVRGVGPEGIATALASCGLAGEEGKNSLALSGGMKQKLALAQALIAEPDILVLDEPCSNLDLKSRREFLAILKTLKGSRTLIITSHRIEEVELLADEVLCLEEGLPARSLEPGAFLASVAAESSLWVQLERSERHPEALAFLAGKGVAASPNGHGIWVDSRPGKTMDTVRLLEAGGFAVRDLRREAGQ